MGGSSSTVAGYRYGMGLHMGICLEADALLEIIAGDRSAWTGLVEESQSIEINAPQLFGGDDREGGIKGTCDVMMGRPDQAENAYLTDQQGLPQPGYRGFLGLVYRGLLTSNNPYIKNWAVRVRSILRGWNNPSGTWYPDQAAIPIGDDTNHQADGYFLVHAGAEITAGGNSYGFVPYDFIGEPDEIAQMALNARNAITGEGLVFNQAYAEVTGSDDFGDTWSIGATSTADPDLAAARVPVQMVCPAGYTPSLIGDGDPIPPGETLPIVACDLEGSHLGMNPAHIVYQCLTDPAWGMGYPEEMINADNFANVADALAEEGFALCLQWSNQSSVRAFTQIIADHTAMNYGQNRTSGLFEIQLLRQDYAPGELPTFHKGNCRVVKYQRPSITDTTNEVIVEYTDIATGKDASTAPLQNSANIAAQGRIVSQRLSFPGLPTDELATRVGMRELQARSTPLWRMTLEFRRGEATFLKAGAPFRVDFRDTEIGAQIILRAVEINFGDPSDSKITAECVEDVFGMPDAVYVGNPDDSPDPPSTAAEDPISTLFELPYREAVQMSSSAEAQALPEDVGFVAAAAVRPPGVPLDFTLTTRLGTTGPFEAVDNGTFCPSMMLAPVPRQNGPTTVAYTQASNLGLLEPGQTAQIGEGRDAETVRIDSINTNAQTVTFARGCGDTVPKEWPSGARLWANDSFLAIDAERYVDGETIQAKVLTNSTGGQEDPHDAATQSITMASRIARPYPPGRLLFNGEESPESVLGEITATWAHRDRILQADTIVDSDDASIGPEPGTTYNARWYVDGVLAHSATGISGTSTSYTPAPGLLRFELEAERDGLVSWQMHDVTLVGATMLLDEDGDPITAENGDPIILE